VQENEGIFKSIFQKMWALFLLAQNLGVSKERQFREGNFYFTVSRRICAARGGGPTEEGRREAGFGQVFVPHSVDFVTGRNPARTPLPEHGGILSS
jgi:hypothetical protein